MEGAMSSARSVYVPLRIWVRRWAGMGDGLETADSTVVAGVAEARVKEDAEGWPGSWRVGV